MRFALSFCFVAPLFAQSLPMGSVAPTSSACTTQADTSTGTVTRNFATGFNSADPYTAGPFVAGSSYTLCKISLNLTKSGTPAFTVTASIYTNVSGHPGVLVGTGSAGIAGASLSTGANTFTGISASLTSGTTYWIVLFANGSVSTSNFIYFNFKDGTTSNYYSSNGTSWTLNDSGNNTALYTTYQ